MTFIKITLQISLALIIASTVFAEEVKLESFGVYIKTDQGYIATDVYSHYRMDFEYYGELAVLTPSSTGLELLVYQPDILPTELAFDSRPLNSPGQSIRVTPLISPISDDQLKVTFQEDIPSDRILMIDTQLGNNSIYAVALSSPLAGFMAGYKMDADITPTNATWSLNKIRVAYPNNADLLQLLKYWTEKEIESQATQQYDWVIKAWHDYEKAQTAEHKLIELEKVKGRIEYYLAEYQDGLETAELEALLKNVTDKLDF